MTRMRVVVLASLAVLAAGVSAQEKSTDATTSNVVDRLEEIRAQADLPALGAALVTLDGVQDVWVTGARRAGGEERVTPEDQWHLGSCTKAMTATLIALLVERGDLDWDTPIGEYLPDLATEMDPSFLEVTLVDLLCHRAGLVANPSDGYGPGEPTDLVAQRAALTEAALRNAPLHEPRGAYLYSNLGFMIAGHVAEVVTGKPWEELLRMLLFEPLGMESAGFGPPGTPGLHDQPQGHGAGGIALEPGPAADNPPAIGPAGTIHASLADWGAFVRLHLAGERGDVRVGDLTLTRETFRRLHIPYDGPGQPYGFGWVMDERDWAGGDGSVLWHNGSNGYWFCITWLGLGKGVAALVVTNRFPQGVTAAADRAVQVVLGEFERRGTPGETR
jgi:D-alanyl-D-alanine carboxypeptidase